MRSVYIYISLSIALIIGNVMGRSIHTSNTQPSKDETPAGNAKSTPWQLSDEATSWSKKLEATSWGLAITKSLTDQNIRIPQYGAKIINLKARQVSAEANMDATPWYPNVIGG